MNKIIEKYMTLQLSTKQFIDEINHNKDLFNEIKGYLPTEKTIDDDKWKGFVYALSLRTHGYDLSQIIKYNFSNGSNPSGKSTMYNFFYKILQANGFNFEYNPFYKERYMLLMDILPNYIGGDEAEIYIDTFIDNLEPNTTESKKKKQIKEFIKKEFVCEKKKPTWIQEPEWPVADKPLKFISQSKNGNCCKYLFEDVSTGVKKEIEQSL